MTTPATAETRTGKANSSAPSADTTPDLTVGPLAEGDTWGLGKTWKELAFVQKYRWLI